MNYIFKLTLVWNHFSCMCTLNSAFSSQCKSIHNISMYFHYRNRTNLEIQSVFWSYNIFLWLSWLYCKQVINKFVCEGVKFFWLRRCLLRAITRANMFTQKQMALYSWNIKAILSWRAPWVMKWHVQVGESGFCEAGAKVITSNIFHIASYCKFFSLPLCNENLHASKASLQFAQ